MCCPWYSITIRTCWVERGEKAAPQQLIVNDLSSYLLSARRRFFIFGTDCMVQLLPRCSCEMALIKLLVSSLSRSEITLEVSVQPRCSTPGRETRDAVPLLITFTQRRRLPVYQKTEPISRNVNIAQAKGCEQMHANTKTGTHTRALQTLPLTFCLLLWQRKHSGCRLPTLIAYFCNAFSLWRCVRLNDFFQISTGLNTTEKFNHCSLIGATYIQLFLLHTRSADAHSHTRPRTDTSVVLEWKKIVNHYQPILCTEVAALKPSV